MRFVWPGQRYDRLTREAAAVAAAVTTCAILAIALSAVRIYRGGDNASGRAVDEQVETVTLAHPSAVAVSPRRRTRHAQFNTPASPPPAQPRFDTSSLNTNRVEAGTGVESVIKLLSKDPKTAPPALGPYSASVAVTLGKIDSGAAPPLPWRLLPPTQEQRDSTSHAEAHRSAVAREDHRPLSIALLSVPLPMPFGGAVRSPEQRARDSVINDDYLKRLARLAERARAKSESTLAARTIARRHTNSTGRQLF